MKYKNIREEELKNKIAKDFFGSFDTTKIIGNIDFCVSIKNVGAGSKPVQENENSILWAEAKQGKSEIFHSLVQLVLTIGKARTFDKFLPPKFLGAVDGEKIAFIEWSEIHEIFYQNDFNWNVTPSNYETREFKMVLEKIRAVETLHATSLHVFDFEKDEKELKNFIKENFVIGISEILKTSIDKNNFMIIYNKWLTAVKPTISVNWDFAKKNNILDGDFYLADLLSKENETLKEKLSVLLKKDRYEYDRKVDEMSLSQEIFGRPASFLDNQKAHTEFWNRYERPPKEEYWDYIVERRDLLVPQDVRERKGSFFTPQIWVEKSQEYIADVLGENWQDEYTIWDCAAGTGNLLAGLTNKYNIWASTLDQADCDVMHDRIKNGANLLPDHIFQFDFLNDDFSKLPEPLQKIINDPEKRKKLVIYINPPYAESGSGMGRDFKKNVSLEHKTYVKYKDFLGKASNELFAQFLARIYFEISGCMIAEFSTLKTLQSSNFSDFRNFLLAKLEKMFVIPADTFDNVKGQFPIGFKIWNTNKKEKFEKIETNVFDESGKFFGKKIFSSHNEKEGKINDWLRQFYDKKSLPIGIMHNNKTDFQHNSQVCITTDDNKDHTTPITKNNLIEMCIYLSVRHVFEANWLNDRDQFLFPNDGWKTDLEFQSDCLAYTIFHGQNKISANIPCHPALVAGSRTQDREDSLAEIPHKFSSKILRDDKKNEQNDELRGNFVNHFIPFTEQEVNSREKFESHFLVDFMNGKIEKEKNEGLFDQNTSQTLLKEGYKMEFSDEAKAVFDAGREIWKYYHENSHSSKGWQTKSDGVVFNVNASLYDIKEFFKGRNEKGRMNTKSKDEKFDLLEKNLSEKLKILAKKIQPKVYEYGFLKK